MPTKTILSDNRSSLLAPLLRDLWLPPIMRPVVEDEFGMVCVDDPAAPTVASLALSDIVMFLGDPAGASASYFLETTPPPYYLMPSSDGWWKRVLDWNPGGARRQKRSLFSESTLEKDRLEQLAGQPPSGVEVRRFDRDIVLEAVSATWSVSFVENFESVEDFLERGIGFGVFHGGRLVAGASSFTMAGGRCEVQVDTHRRFRRRGLATLASSHLLLYCLEKGLRPHWDAANAASCALAGKLGFSPAGNYEVLRVRRSVADRRRSPRQQTISPRRS